MNIMQARRLNYQVTFHYSAGRAQQASHLFGLEVQSPITKSCLGAHGQTAEPWQSLHKADGLWEITAAAA